MKKYDSDKIKAMSVQERKDWINAIDELYSQYKNNDNSYECPLCKISDHGCDNCLWIIFEDEYCTIFSDHKGFSIFIQYESPRWKRIRYPMLRRWKRILQRGE